MTKVIREASKHALKAMKDFEDDAKRIVDDMPNFEDIISAKSNVKSKPSEPALVAQ